MSGSEISGFAAASGASFLMWLPSGSHAFAVAALACGLAAALGRARGGRR